MTSTRPFIAARIEERVDTRIEALMRAIGWQEKVIGYTGYGSSRGVRVLGRVVLVPKRAKTQLGKATEELMKRRGWRNFFTVPCGRLPVTIVLGERTLNVVTDRGGYLDVRIRNHGLNPGWHNALVRSAEAEPADVAVQIVGDEATFGMVSDIDDTIITTSLPRPMIAAYNTFVRTEAARQSVPGMAKMYRQLLSEHPGAPLIFVSTGAWNTQPFLKRFLARHGYPNGPMLMTDWGPTNTGWFRSGVTHKRDSLAALARDFPDIKWLLVGDDGQHDPQIYGDFVREHPERVRAVAIRQLTPTEQVLAHGSPTSLDEDGEQGDGDVPWVFAPDGDGLLAALADALD